MITVNCGAIPEGIIESELFGHVKGAYTDAKGDRKGYFESADNSTIFLDEIGETPLETQVKLLRVIESGEFIPVGGSKAKKTDVRILAATNKDLAGLVSKGLFRQDLYYRLNTVSIPLPPLNDRLEDISLLVERFALEFTRSNDIRYRGFTSEAIRLMKRYDWPGNVRELKHFIEKIIVLNKGERISVENVQKELIDSSIANTSKNSALPVIVDKTTNKAEIDLILRQLFMLKQDTELIQNLILNSKVSNRSPESIKGIGEIVKGNISLPEKSMEIIEENGYFINSGAIGDFSIKDLEKEAITRTLKFFNNNRRKTARSLGLSERTLYRKIDQYGLEPKIKINS